MSGFWHVGMCIELIDEKLDMLDNMLDYPEHFDDDFTEDDCLEEMFETLLTREVLIHDL